MVDGLFCQFQTQIKVIRYFSLSLFLDERIFHFADCPQDCQSVFVQLSIHFSSSLFDLSLSIPTVKDGPGKVGDQVGEPVVKQVTGPASRGIKFC